VAAAVTDSSMQSYDFVVYQDLAITSEPLAMDQ